MNRYEKDLPAYTVDDEPQAVWDMTKYLRRLIIESPYIRARLNNPGGSILLLPSSEPERLAYGTTIGNDAHLDLIEAESVMNRDFSQGERDEIKRWAQGFTSTQAAEYHGVKNGAVMRKRRERLIAKLETRMNGRVGGTGDGDTAAGVEGQPQQPAQGRDSGRETPEASPQAGDTAEFDRGKAA